MTVKQMLAGMNSREISEWIAFYQLEADMHKEAAIRADMERKLHG